MPIFVTYARKDRPAVEALGRDLERAHNSVWLDNELTGGQAWWDTILGQIRACDLYLFALSPESLKSRACNVELQYALAVGRPLLPVLIQDVHITMAPPAIADTHIVDYRTRTAESGIALISAVANRPPAPPLPDPLPVPPPPPMSYMNEFRELVEAPYLTYQQQNHLLVDLRGYLNQDDDDRTAALSLIWSLRQRRDIAEGVGREIDRLLQVQRPQPQPQPFPHQPQPQPFLHQPQPQPQPFPSQPQPQPQPQQSFPPPQSAPSATAQPLGTGLIVTFLLLAAFIPLAGLIVGLVVRANPSRRSQGVGIIVASIVGFIVWWALLQSY